MARGAGEGTHLETLSPCGRWQAEWEAGRNQSLLPSHLTLRAGPRGIAEAEAWLACTVVSGGLTRQGPRGRGCVELSSLQTSLK